MNNETWDRFFVGTAPGFTFWYPLSIITDVRLAKDNWLTDEDGERVYNDGQVWGGYVEYGRISYFLPGPAAAPPAGGATAGTLTLLGVGI
jgi:hypothetical protein